MKVKFDFSLGRSFGVIEQTIFRLVLNGITDTQQISDLLWVFSDRVIAIALRKLVNEQILKADINSKTLSLSDSIEAIIEMCIKTTDDLQIPDSLQEMTDDKGCLLIRDVAAKEMILNRLLPEAKLGFLAKSLDFIICRRGEMSE